jgi:hypothetical protein
LQPSYEQKFRIADEPTGNGVELHGLACIPYLCIHVVLVEKHFGVACYKKATVSAAFEAQDSKSSRFALGPCEKSLRLLQPYYYENRDAGEGFTIAECVPFSPWLFARDSREVLSVFVGRGVYGMLGRGRM